MDNFEYKVSVIVPVYNVEQYLRDCLDSLLAQTMDHEQMEVLLINDGSTDGSLAICEEYAELFSCFKVFSQENAGPAAARNRGLQEATGKFIAFLDSDDRLSNVSLENICHFFNSVYDRVDVVTYPIFKYNNKFEKTSYFHFRYKYLIKSGVYSLIKYPYITQTTMNICVKNKGNNSILFDVSEKTMVHEDQKFINHLLKNKMEIGFCAEAEYMYLVHENSVMAMHYNAIELWEPTIEYYENLFAQFDTVPQYYQGMLLHDINWKLRDNALFPYHYEKQEFAKAMSRLSNLIDKIDIETILQHPNIDKFHKYYFLALGRKLVVPIISEGVCQLVCNGKAILIEKTIEVIIRRIKIIDGKFLRIYGSIKTPLFSFIDKPNFFAFINNMDYEEIALSLSGSSWYKSKSRTNTFWQFIFEYDIEKISSLQFKVRIEGIYFNTRFWFDRLSPFNDTLRIQEYILGNYSVEFRANMFYFQKADYNKKELVYKKMESKFSPSILSMRKMYINFNHQEEIWLYYDNYTVDYDNGYLQFIHDFDKNDGIKRYYIYDKETEEIKHLFSQKHEKSLIKFGSQQHKKLYLNASKVLTAFIEHFSLSPFKSNEEKNYIDLFHAEIIYLQHGVLHASIPWYYTPEMVENDKVVVSSYFELQNMVHNYGYREKDLIPTGMPRYEKICREKTPSNKIIFAPSWRDYLVGKFVDSETRRDNSDEKFINSNYYKNIMGFLKNSKLHELLEENDIYLDLKFHPNFYGAYGHLVDFDFERIQFIEGNNKVDLADYKLFITDFSSFVFDYAYLSRPIIYFVPDYMEFKSGMNRYRELDLPYEKAFGNLTIEPESVVDEIVRIIKNDFIPDAVFKERMENFYLPFNNNCSEALYRYILLHRNEDNLT